jgi:hypothetical protein
MAYTQGILVLKAQKHANRFTDKFVKESHDRHFRKSRNTGIDIVLYYYYCYYYLNVIGLAPAGSSTHLHTNSTQNTEDGTYKIITKKKKLGSKLGSAGRAPSLRVIRALAFALQLRKKHGKTSVKVVERCPDNPVAAVQYTFTHKQYTQQHNETEYT